MGTNIKEYEWSFKPKATSGNYYGDQQDWNHTILVKFNQMIAESNYDSETDYLVIPRKYEPIIKSLEFYGEEKCVLWSFDNRPDKKIYFTDDKTVQNIRLGNPDALFPKAKLEITDYIDEYQNK